jgi:hypothetical protein
MSAMQPQLLPLQQVPCQYGMQTLGHEAAVHVFAPPSPLGVPHAPATHARPAPQLWQERPPLPQLSGEAPPLHTPALVQQPLHVSAQGGGPSPWGPASSASGLESSVAVASSDPASVSGVVDASEASPAEPS